MASCLVAENRGFRENLWMLCQFILGRLMGYVLFGLFFGFLGEKINSYWINLAADLALVLLSLTLILYLSGLRRQSATAGCAKTQSQLQAPLIMGFLMGINICPPFLLSLSYIVTLHSTLKGVFYFVLFFLSSSIYFLPFAFAGMLARMKSFQTVARIGGLLSAVIFFIYGIYSIGHNLYGLAQP
jgi:sulfite exporter TauE/SafE